MGGAKVNKMKYFILIEFNELRYVARINSLGKIVYSSPEGEKHEFDTPSAWIVCLKGKWTSR
jgi:hypothetical protein